MCGRCGIRSLKFFVGKEIIFADTETNQKNGLAGYLGKIESANDQEKTISVVCTDETFGPAGPYDLTIDDVTIQ